VSELAVDPPSSRLISSTSYTPVPGIRRVRRTFPSAPSCTGAAEADRRADAALAELREIAGGRGDLLADTAVL
jgi:hypothetical protein